MWYIPLLSILAVVVLGVTIYIWRRWYKDIDEDPSTGMARSEAQLRRIVKQLPVQMFDDKGTEFVVGFQGGTFILSYKPFMDSFEVTFPNFSSFTCEELPTALVVANNIHDKYNVWRCTLQIEKMGTSEKAWNASMSCYVSLADEKKAAEYLDANMGTVFYIARDFDELFLKEKRANHYSIENLKSADFNNKIALAKNVWQSLPHDTTIAEAEDEVNGAPLTISRLLTLWQDVDFGDIVSLRILAEGKSEKTTEKEKILAFDIYDFILHHHTEAWADDFALQLTTQKEGLLILLRRADGCTDKTLFYNLTMYRTGLRNTYDAIALFTNTRIEIRLTPPDNDRWETQYMIKEALAKMEKEGFNNLSETEKAIVAMGTESIQAHIYWGKRYYNAGCFYQALEHFRFVYRHCRDNWHQLNKLGRECYFEVCYYIGFVYLDMRMMEKAHYFLEIASHTQNMAYIEEYVNCLCNMKDPSALSYIASCATQINKLISDNGPEDSLLAFRAFLERRYVYTQIDMHLYDEARQHLNQMIEQGNSVEFAKGELAYLDRLTKTTPDEVSSETNEE